MSLDDMKLALDEAYSQLRRADILATRIAGLLTGRLRSVENAQTLRRLKREIASFNSRTGKWNDA